MKTKKKNKLKTFDLLKPRWWSLILIATIFFVIAWFSKLIPYDYSWSFRSLGLFLNIILAIVFLLIVYKKGFKWETLFYLLFWGGLFLKFSYAYTTPISLRQHDVGAISLSEPGHYGYILNIFTNWKLPDSNVYQFYHPPLYHAISALYLQLVHLIDRSLTVETLFTTLPLISVIIAGLTSLISGHIIKCLNWQRALGLPLMLLLNYHPIFILLSGRHNNDGLSVLFIFLTIYLFIKWFQSKRRVYLYLLAVSIGLGMMSKLTVAMITPIIGLFMIIHLIDTIKKKGRYGRVLLSYIIFALIVFPLGLWYPIRNYILFKQPLGYVFEITNPALSVSDVPWYFRFLSDHFATFFNNIYANAGEDYNIWQYLIKTSIFGEFNYWGAHVYGLLLLVVNCLFFLTMIVSLYFIVRLIVKEKNKLDLFMGLYLLTLFISYLLFNIRYPFGPTMDFRYLIPTVFIVGYFIARLAAKKRFFTLTQILSVTLSLLSIMFFTFAY